MSFLTLLAPPAEKPRWSNTLAEAFPYFFKAKRHEPGDQELMSLEAIKSQSQVRQEEYGTQYIAFTFSAIALAAKLVQIDGEAKKEEIEAFYTYFPMPGGSREKGANLFYEAYMDTADTRLYAKKITGFYPGNTGLYIQLLQALIKLAFADAPMNNQEYALIRKIASIFGLDEEAYKNLLRAEIIPHSSDPYVLLGARRKASHSDVKKAYREIIRECHPDTFARFANLAPEVKTIMVEKFKRLTNAYEAICKYRKFEG